MSALTPEQRAEVVEIVAAAFSVRADLVARQELIHPEWIDGELRKRAEQREATDGRP